jgi:hypothetical protein
VSSEEVVAIVVAITGLLAAIGVLIRSVAELRTKVDGRMSELLEEARRAASKEGELRGRDHALQDFQRAGPRRRRLRSPDLYELRGDPEGE